MWGNGAYLKSIAVFMIALILGLPVYVSDVYAGGISLSIKGNDDVEGYVKKQDDITFSANVSVYGDSNITVTQLELTEPCPYAAGCTPFDYCGPIGSNWFKCTYLLDHTSDWAEQENNATVRLYKDDGSLAYERTESFIVDNKKPAINSFDILQIGQNVSINFDVNDSACDDPSCSGKCSGIKSVKISAGEGEKIDLTEPTGDCAVESANSIKLIDLGIKDFTGDKTFTLEVCDRLNQCSSITQTITVDAKKPDIADGRLLSSSGKKVLAFANPFAVYFYVNISDENFASATADFSDLCIGSSCTGKRGLACNSVGGSDYLCNYTNVQLSKGGKVNVTAVDVFGNSKSEIFDFGSISQDLTGPVVESIESSSGDYVKSVVNITATLSEDGTVEKDGIYLKVTNGATDLGYPEKCENTAQGEWKCYWKDVKVIEDGKLKLNVDPCHDNLNNRCQGMPTKTFIIDKTPPAVENFSIKGIEGSKAVDYLRTGMNGAVITLLINDSSNINAYADLSSIMGSSWDNEKADSCLYKNGLYECVWNLGYITKTGDANINFRIIDSANNVKTKSEPIHVDESADWDGEYHYSVVIHNDKTYPLDKNVLAAGISYQEIIPFTLEYQGNCPGDNIKIVDAELEGSGIICGNVDDPYRYVTINRTRNSDDYAGFMQMPVTSSDYENAIKDQSYVSVGNGDDYCNLKLITRCNDKVYSQPETHSIILNLSVEEYGKEFSDEMVDKIKEIKDDVNKGYKKTIGDVEDGFVLATNFCRLYSVLGRIYSALTALSKVLETSGVGKGVATAVQGAANSILMGIDPSTGLGKFFKGACGVITCQSTLPRDRIGIRGTTAKIQSGFCGYLAEDMKEDGLLGGIAGSANTLDLCKKSWLFSTACFCVPGLIYNLEKKRNIECYKAVCYRDMIRAGITDKSGCDSEYAYKKCVYGKGQWYGMWADRMRGFAKGIVETLMNPLATAWEQFQGYANKKCIATNSGLFCWANALMLLTESAAIFDQIETTSKTLKWPPPNQEDWCNILNKEVEVPQQDVKDNYLEFPELMPSGYDIKIPSKKNRDERSVEKWYNDKKHPERLLALSENLDYLGYTKGGEWIRGRVPTTYKEIEPLVRAYQIDAAINNNIKIKVDTKIDGKTLGDIKDMSSPEWDKFYKENKKTLDDAGVDGKAGKNTVKGMIKKFPKDKYGITDYYKNNAGEIFFSLMQGPTIGKDVIKKLRGKDVSLIKLGDAAKYRINEDYATQYCDDSRNKSMMHPMSAFVLGKDYPAYGFLPTLHIQGRRTEYAGNISYVDSAGNTVQFPRKGESPGWFPESTDYLNYEPLGYLYYVSYYIKNPYSSEQIAQMSEESKREVGLQNNKDGNITGRVYINTTSEDVKQRAKVYENNGIKTGGWFEKFNIAPGKEINVIKASYKLSYYEKACIEFDNYKYNGRDKSYCANIIKNELKGYGAWEITPPASCEKNADCGEGMICDTNKKICKKTEGGFSGGGMSRGSSTPTSDDQVEW